MLLVALGVAAFQFVRLRLGPMLAEASEARAIASIVDQCRTYAGGEDMVAARKACQAVVDREPGNQAVCPCFRRSKRRRSSSNCAPRPRT